MSLEAPITRSDLIVQSQERRGLPQGVTAKDIIAKTRDGIPLESTETNGFINHYVTGEIPDYQAAAWLMAVRLNGLTLQETVDLTLAMAASGEILDLSEFGHVADKHSSGGVGDKTTLVVGPLVAACGIPVGKMSGRGLEHTGGTLDKLESIPGLRVDLTKEEFLQQLREVGLVVTGQTSDLAPADGKLYALRDVTETVASIPLIASSIMSKKIASGPDTLVLDVKVGKAAFMKTLDDARQLARVMVDIGKSVGINCVAEISDMNQPLGFAVGNSLEVKEAILTLDGNGPDDFSLHCLETAARLVFMSGRTETFNKAQSLVAEKIRDGTALRKFAQMIEAQGGNPGVTENIQLLPKAPYSQYIFSPQSGYLAMVDPLLIGRLVMALGGGRKKKGDLIDTRVGLEFYPKVGQKLEIGDPVACVFAKSKNDLNTSLPTLTNSFTLSDQPVEPLPHIYEIVE